MTITNKHVGWIIILILLLFPFFYMLLASNTPEWVAYWAAMSLLLGICAGAVALFWTLLRLFDDDIEFKWHIPIDKWFGRKKLSKDHTRELFLKLHELPQDSKEWETVYNELDKKGQWG